MGGYSQRTKLEKQLIGNGQAFHSGAALQRETARAREADVFVAQHFVNELFNPIKERGRACQCAGVDDKKDLTQSRLVAFIHKKS